MQLYAAYMRLPSDLIAHKGWMSEGIENKYYANGNQEKWNNYTYIRQS